LSYHHEGLIDNLPQVAWLWNSVTDFNEAPMIRMKEEFTMTLAEFIYQHSLNLPEPAAREALDFIQFLESRYGVVTGKAMVEQAVEAKRAAALKRLTKVRLHFGGKPIANRDELYDNARG
jgi:hypothetical protein